MHCRRNQQSIGDDTVNDYQDIYNKVCQIWLAESVRLADKTKQAEDNLWKNGLTADKVITYFKAEAVQKYFDEYMIKILDYLKELT